MNFLKTTLLIALSLSLTSCSLFERGERTPSSKVKITVCVKKANRIIQKARVRKLKRIEEGIFKNQCSFGSCWSHANSGLLENLILKEFNERLEVSTSFFFYHHMKKQIRNKIQNVIEKGLKDTGKIEREKFIVDGANFDEFMRLMKSNGVRPLLSEKDRVFEKNLVRERLKFKKDIVGVLTHPRVQMKIENLLNEYSSFNDIPKEHIRVLVDDVVSEGEKVLDKAFPVKTENFIYKGKIYTNESFAKKYRLDEVQKRQFFTDEKGKNLDRIKSILKSRLDEGRNTYITLAWLRKYMDTKTGVFSTNSKIIMPKTLKKLRRENAHAVQVVGYEEDEFGKVSSWIVQNSHGRRVGQNGYFYLDADFFDKFLTSIAYLEMP